MQKDKLNEMINLYFDDKLSKGEEALLFTQLAGYEEMRQVFKEHNALRAIAESGMEKFPDELDQRILDNVLAEYNARSKEPSAGALSVYSRTAVYIFTLVLLVLSIFLYGNTRRSQEQLETAIQQIKQQNKMIELLFTGLPETTIEGKIDNQILIKANL